MSTSVARLIPSMSECRHPYLLSNLDLVTASFTLMAVNRSSPVCSISLRRWTPVVVSSDTPLIPAATVVHRAGSSVRPRVRTPSTTPNSSVSAVDGSGTWPTFSNSTPLWTSKVASPPSSRIMVGPSPGHSSACSVHHQYSSRVSPFHAKTGTPLGWSTVPSGPTATAAAAWSWVEKMLQLAQRTSAPSATRVSMSTAVWMVMCREPVIRAPSQRLLGPVLGTHGHQTGHLVLGQFDLLAAVLGEREISHLEVGSMLLAGHGAPSLWPATGGSRSLPGAGSCRPGCRTSGSGPPVRRCCAPDQDP